MSHLPIIDRWPSLSEFAGDIGQSYNTTKAIRRRGSIPPRYWEDVVRGARARGIKDVTFEALAEAAKRRAVNIPMRSAGDAEAT